MNLYKCESTLLPLVVIVGIMALALFLSGTACEDEAEESAAKTVSEKSMLEKAIYVTALAKERKGLPWRCQRSLKAAPRDIVLCGHGNFMTNGHN